MVNSPTLAPLPPDERVFKEALDAFNTRLTRYKLYNNYYDGKHNLNFATTKWRNTFGGLFQQFSDNLCAPIVDAAADRLIITGFQVPNSEPTSKALWEYWTRSKMDRVAGQIHEHALKVGDAYAIVWPDPLSKAPIIAANPAHQIYISYADDSPNPLWAAKLWKRKDDRWRLTIYYPNSIEKYITTSTMKSAPTHFRAFNKFIVPTEMWPLPNPYSRIPVFHFANNSEMGTEGQSELYNVVPIQDALNKAVADMLVAMEYVSLPQRYVTGLEVDEDPVTGKQKVPFESGVDRVWAAEDSAARFGQFESADFSSFTNVQNDLRLEMARISRTPLHYLSLGGPSEGAFVSSMYPSGESLKTAEAPFIAKLHDRQVSFGDVWEEIIAFAAHIATPDSDELTSADIETVWEAPTPRSMHDDLLNADAKLNKLGIPREIVWAELGYTPEQIREMIRLAPDPAPVQANPDSTTTAGRPVRTPTEAERTTSRTAQNSNGNK